jgi:hypothetical protein
LLEDAVGFAMPAAAAEGDEDQRFVGVNVGHGCCDAGTPDNDRYYPDELSTGWQG